MVAMPDTDNARQLLPWRWSTIAATATRSSDDRSSLRRWRDTLGVAGLLTIGGLQSRRRFSFDVSGSLTDHLSTQLDLGDAHAIALCGPPRANQKPVLQLHDHRGRSLAFVKVAWSELTRRLLHDEHDALLHLASQPQRGFAVPAVRGLGTFGETEWLALSPVAVDERRPATTESNDDLARLIEATGVDSHGPTPDANYVERLRCDTGDLEMAGEIVPLLIDRHADRLLACGATHGDFVPWNILSGSPRSAVWDWERYRPEAPVGFDRLHVRVQVGLRAESMMSVLHHVAGQLDQILPELAPEDREAHFNWYVADLLNRYERDLLDHPSDRLSTWALELHLTLKERLNSP
jgi:hypothetical protein